MSLRTRLLKKMCKAAAHQGREAPYTDAEGVSWMICPLCDSKRRIGP